MQKKMRMLKAMLIVVLIAVCVGGWVSLASPGAKEVKPKAPVPQTGQTQCWDASGTLIPCDGTGQDGDFQAGVAWPTPRFTDRGEGTVRDNLTGLIWLKNANCFPGSGTGIPWQEALEAANTLASGSCGLSDRSRTGDWRLPNVNELQSVIDRSNFNPALPAGHPFSDVQSDYWTSNLVTANPKNLAWFVELTGGGVGGVNWEVSTLVVWPVRGDSLAFAKKVKPVAPVPQTGQTQCWDASGTLIPCDGTGQDGDFQAGVAWPTPRFTDRGEGTVRDNLTGLIWLKNANCFPGSGTGIPWQEALEAANTLASGSCGLLDGSVAGDWRLPNVNELRSLIDWGNFSPALPAGHPFSGVPSGPNIAQWAYLTSTSIEDSPNYVWYVYLANGNALRLNKGIDAALVWPVRGGD